MFASYFRGQQSWQKFMGVSPSLSGTPLLRLGRYGQIEGGHLPKLEYFNPLGSVKIGFTP